MPGPLTMKVHQAAVERFGNQLYKRYANSTINRTVVATQLYKTKSQVITQQNQLGMAAKAHIGDFAQDVLKKTVKQIMQKPYSGVSQLKTKTLGIIELDLKDRKIAAQGCKAFREALRSLSKFKGELENNRYDSPEFLGETLKKLSISQDALGEALNSLSKAQDRISPSVVKVLNNAPSDNVLSDFQEGLSRN